MTATSSAIDSRVFALLDLLSEMTDRSHAVQLHCRDGATMAALLLWCSSRNIALTSSPILGAPHYELRMGHVVVDVFDQRSIDQIEVADTSSPAQHTSDGERQ